ncbi:HAMP domain-containing sensor histidine kinase [Mucilaginibacter sp. CAU 1740]|uniref:sensor histidine kinase n=1 Tax=Mucilaginibacter sp. CAU 1740 TaxID=3140365 RepID=UPI00325A51D1
MSFPGKFGLLIAGSLLVFAGLCWMQYRLLAGTHRLEKAAWLRLVTERMGLAPQAAVDSLNHRGMQLLMDSVKAGIRSGRMPDVSGMQGVYNRLLRRENDAVLRALAGDSLLRNTRYRFSYSRVILYNGLQADTLLNGSGSNGAIGSLVLTGSGGDNTAAAFQVGQSMQQAGFPLDGKIYRLGVWTESTLDAPGWQRLVFKRMAFTLAGSALLIAAALAIFVLAFLAIFRQKRVADITTDFANNMTHELKTPLSAAGVVVRSLRTPEAMADQVWTAELLDQLEKQLGRIGRIMDSVMGSALGAQGTIFGLRAVNLQEVAEDLRELAKQSGRELICSVDEGLTGYTDPDRLTGILVNLLDNAIKYTEGPISLRFTRAGREMHLSIGDRGPAIPHRYRPYLFDKFFRVPQPDAHDVKGLGLGLYICQQQAALLNGRIRYVESPDGGNLFTLILKVNGTSDTDRRG